MAKYWRLSYRISASNEYSGLIFFRIDWFDVFTIQGTVESLFWHHSLKALILQPSVVFIVQLSYLYMSTGETISLTIQTFVGKVMSLLFNMLSRFVIAFLPRSKYFLISLVVVPVYSDFGAQNNKICHYFHCFPIYLP